MIRSTEHAEPEPPRPPRRSGAAEADDLGPGPDLLACPDEQDGRPRGSVLGWSLAGVALAVLSVAALVGVGTDRGGQAQSDGGLSSAGHIEQLRAQEIDQALRYDQPSPELAAAVAESIGSSDSADSAEPSGPSELPGPVEAEPEQVAESEQAASPAGARLEVSTGGVPADVTWVDAQGATQSARSVAGGAAGDQADLWATELTAASPADLPGAMVMAQLQGAGSISCRVLWAGQVVSEQTDSGAGAAVMCALR